MEYLFPSKCKFVDTYSIDRSRKNCATMFTEGMRPHVTKEDINLPSGYQGKLAFVLHNVLTEEECNRFIQETERIGYIPALVNVGGGREKMMTDVRSSKRCIVDSVPYVQELWERIKEFIPSVFKEHRVLGLNERLRFLRYDAGDYFRPHFDGSYKRDNGERSYITFQLYLNEGFEGGATTFIGVQHDLVPVIPKTGSVLIFQHDICHEGSELTAGRKYTVRTDIMSSAERVDSVNTSSSCEL
ncbi:unnamed protein product [Candidula unifasciata]|uniref:Fe2OG dioxygenase domain-containing protein n=1 Tax=Candidula unifasciata TaxID=100452 RepID=A0A8S3Z055_9EUPU|nr:unnamed protein product [Candidula unifasciata]